MVDFLQLGPFANYKTDEPCKGITTDSDMAVAAKQLMQLSGDEDKNINNNDIDNQTNMQNVYKRKGVMSNTDSTQSKEKNHQTREYCSRPKRQRYRSILHLYMATKPINNIVHGKTIESRGKTNQVVKRPVHCEIN